MQLYLYEIYNVEINKLKLISKKDLFESTEGSDNKDLGRAADRKEDIFIIS